MVDADDMRRVDRMFWHLGQIYKVEKHKDAKDLLLHQSLEKDTDCMGAVQAFKEDPKVLQTFRREASMFLYRQRSHANYDLCLELLSTRLMFLRGGTKLQ